MPDIKSKFATAAAFTITLASLTNNSARQSTEIDNATNLYLDALIGGKITSGAASTSSTGLVAIYAFASADDQTNRTENAGASDAAITLTSPTNLRLVGIVNVVANATTYRFGPFSVAAAFGGILPKYWGIVVVNLSGGTLDADAGDHAISWQGVLSQF